MSATAVIACGALAVHVRQVAVRRQLAVDIFPLPPELHNRPERIPAAVAGLADELALRYARIAVAYADCGTYGALDDVLGERGLARLGGAHCYDVFASAEVAAAREQEPGTYFLTDFLVRSFDRVVWRGLGLDRYPDLRDDYFRHYRRVIWFAQRRSDELEAAAQHAADRLGLALEISDVGETGLERQLVALVNENLEAGS